jgi:hypothetical protein
MAANTEAVEGGGAEQGFVHFGDICVFKENNTKSYLTCPLTSSHHANLVVPDGKGNGGGVPGASFQSCQFQIVAEEKSKWCAKVNKSVHKLMHAQARERDQQLAAARRAATEKAKSASLRGKKNIGFQTEDESALLKQDGPLMEILPDADVDNLLDDESLMKEKEMALAEMRDNDLTQARQFGFPCHYGDVIQIWHPYVCALCAHIPSPLRGSDLFRFRVSAEARNRRLMLQPDLVTR